MAESNNEEVILYQPDNALTFRATMSNIFKNVAESVSEEEFAECLTFLKSKSSIICKLHKAMVDDLYESMCGELKEILADGNMSEGLTKLKKLIVETPKVPNHIAWRPPGNVSEHLRSYDMEKIIEEHEKLKTLVEGLETENDILKEQITAKRAAVQKINDRVNRASKTGSLALPQMQKAATTMEEYIEILYE